MTLRSGHGTGAGSPRVEVLPPDELPRPVPAPKAEPSASLVFGHGHKIADSATAKELGARGGRAKARRLKLIDSLGLAAIVEGTEFAPYREAADRFHEHHVGELARMAGGEVGSGPSSFVASAALQLAASRFLFDQAATTGMAATLKTASTLANDSRQNLLAAYELAVREAEARRKSGSKKDRTDKHMPKTIDAKVGE